MATNKIFLFTLFAKSPQGNKNAHRDWSDEELVKAITTIGDGYVFGILYDRYAVKVYNKCYSFVKDRDEAKDLMQDVFLRAYLKIDTFNPAKASFSTWLYVVTYNLCTNYVVRGKIPRQKEETGNNKKIESIETEDISIEDINDLDPDKLATAMNKIAPEDKALLLLKYQDDASIKSIQELLGVGESAVKMRLRRAKLKVIKTYHEI